MTKEQLTQAVWELIDQNSMELSQTEYIDFLMELEDEALGRCEAVREDVANQQNED